MKLPIRYNLITRRVQKMDGPKLSLKLLPICDNLKETK